MKVLIVDDSVVFRSQIKAALSAIPGVEVVGSAANGKIALTKLLQTPVDLITMDFEMPEMNGLETLKELRKQGHKTRVIMFSSLTTKGGAVALEALRCGADDVIAKPAGENLSIENATEAIAKDLMPKILQFVENKVASAEKDHVVKTAISQCETSKSSMKNLFGFKPEVIVIGSSTGGPSALETIFKDFNMKLRIPILIVQHMPPVFTKCLADRIKEISGVETVEASQMELLQPNKIYIAPGNYHMTLHQNEAGVFLKLDQGPQQNMVRPAVDPLFASAAEVYKDKCMSFVLTGMGEDGCRGARTLKAAGSGVMIQNKESCVVFGMPGSIFNAGIYDRMGDLSEIRKILIEMARENSL